MAAQAGRCRNFGTAMLLAQMINESIGVLVARPDNGFYYDKMIVINLLKT
jgi:hypothetical protein